MIRYQLNERIVTTIKGVKFPKMTRCDSNSLMSHVKGLVAVPMLDHFRWWALLISGSIYSVNKLPPEHYHMAQHQSKQGIQHDLLQ